MLCVYVVAIGLLSFEGEKLLFTKYFGELVFQKPFSFFQKDLDRIL